MTKCLSCQREFYFESLYLEHLCLDCQTESEQLDLDDLKAELGYQGNLNQDFNKDFNNNT